ncbi:MAG TPA: ABC transporter ATP-binding protein [Candidatus Dormibacteraeota bacterium]|jgi:ABC-type branched-subunit amino acid transport system ATPase component|nr:ABC transporter ATP-binding protein [Candidatus Dormibacteraeota bacterium]
MSLLAVENLTVRYGGAVLALDDVSFEVPEGGAVGLLGANGAGKTTVLRAVSGLLRFHSGAIVRGSVTFNGRSIVNADASRLVAGGIAQVLEGRRIFRDLTVADNLRAGGFATSQRRGSQDEVRDRVLELFPILGERLHQSAGFLSGGEQQMLAVGRALMARPRLLLLDEPSLGLAPLVVRQIGKVLQAINGDGVALLLVDQSTALALEVTKYGYLLETGHVVHQKPTADLLADPAVRASYLGTAAGDEAVQSRIEESVSP